MDFGSRSDRQLWAQSRHLARSSKAVFQPGCKCKAIGLFGAQAIVFVTNSLTDLIQQPCGAQHRKGGGFNRLNLVLWFHTEDMP